MLAFRDGVLDQAVPPTGREIDFEQIHVLDLRDGKVVRHEAVRDDIVMLGRLGVFPPARPPDCTRARGLLMDLRGVATPGTHSRRTGRKP
ncbi:hypothetical protein [Streptomyces sp. NPDC050263]|uniref:hypothetical protein n=1 Tax=Streptomyces sp. NPDC050263 TaxID=3155037 RepID=UPI0034344DCB